MLHLVGNGMNENHTMHIQSDSLTCRAQAYILRMLGVSACSAVYNPFSSCLRLSHRERKVSWPVGAEIRCLCYLSFMVWQQQIVVVRASEKESYCRLYQDSGDWESVFALSLFRISCQLFPFPLLLPIFSRYAGLVDHAGVEFGPRKNTSSFTS